MAIEIIKRGAVVARSRNLRGALTYARKHGLNRIAAHRRNSHGDLYIAFGDGAELRTRFESYSVLIGWILARRSWRQGGLEQSSHWPDSRHWHVPSYVTFPTRNA
jgi:hypothetical protein